MSDVRLTRIPPHFHQTFAPERSYIADLLHFLQEPCELTVNEISKYTGIPMGKSTGKVGPTIDYARGMNLINETRLANGVRRLSTSTLGHLVFTEDPFLSESLTQWLLHFMFCRKYGGADVWFTLFGKSRIKLGKRFKAEKLKEYLYECYGEKTYLPGPIVRMYTNDSAFISCNALQKNGIFIERNSAPHITAFFFAYALLLHDTWDSCFELEKQVSLDAFNDESKYFDVLGWTSMEIDSFLTWLVTNSLMKLDRQTGPTVMLRLHDTDSILPKIYSTLP